MKKLIERLKNYIKKLAPRERMIFYAAAAVVAIVIFDRAVFNPVAENFSAVDKELKDKYSGLKKDLHILAQEKKILSLK